MENLEERKESPGRLRLRELESVGDFVFHGSGHKLQRLEPRQAYNYSVISNEGKVLDDKPAVFASPRADIAIFRAIINKNNIQRGLRSGFSFSGDGDLEFRATRATIDQTKNVKGYVYVFDKLKFIPRSSGELLSYEPVEPVEVVEVSEKDLPQNIEIKDF